MIILMSLFLLVPIYSIIGAKDQGNGNGESGDNGFPHSIYEKILENDFICTIFGIGKDPEIKETESVKK